MSATATAPIDLIQSALQWEVVAELNNDPHAQQEHMRRIKALSPHIFRIVATAQHILVAQNPELVRDLLTRPYTNLGFNVIGLGGTSTVLELGDEVMKVLWATRHQSAQEQQNALCELGSDQNILINSLGDFALTQRNNKPPTVSAEFWGFANT
jgi:hypothetical protein